MRKKAIAHYPQWKRKLYEIIFESDTTAGKITDVAILIAITLSVIVLFIESIPGIQKEYQFTFLLIEIFFTIIFLVEYILRLIAVPKPLRYATSFFGIIDLASVLPTLLGLLFPQLHYLMLIRMVRLLRVFRIFGMTHFMGESASLIRALWRSRIKILVFFFTVFIITSVAGVIMYVIESPHNKDFESIPQSIYWAIVTITTVGYGDVSPITALGKFIASLIMLLGYSIIAVPTGIITAQFAREKMQEHDYNTQTCPHCFKVGHDPNAKFCKYCGHHL